VVPEGKSTGVAEAWVISCRKAEIFMADTTRSFETSADRSCRNINGRQLLILPERLEKTRCEAVILCSEALDGLLRKRDYAQALFHRIGKLNLEPKLVLFVRNQSQLINSRYAQVAKGFRCCESFEAFVQGLAQRPDFRYSPLIDLADAFHAELIPRRFNEETIAHGVVAAFL
jgi:hypothetical protein